MQFCALASIPERIEERVTAIRVARMYRNGAFLFDIQAQMYDSYTE